jgi:uncharacterized protein YdeI (YjbR/CyaY-like superfamily)
MQSRAVLRAESEPVFFESGAAFRKWLGDHGASATEVWLGFHKKSLGRSGITYREALDEALCSGWIDGVRKSIDEGRFKIRFTPRKPKSIWSKVNIRRVRELMAAGRMKAAGLAAFERRQKGPAPYSFESAPRTLDRASEKLLRANRRAQTFFETQPPSYRRLVSFWVMSAKRAETRARRLRTLIDCCAAGEPIPPLRWARRRSGTHRR